jgi:hypothetical protein
MVQSVAIDAPALVASPAEQQLVSDVRDNHEIPGSQPGQPPVTGAT